MRAGAVGVLILAGLGAAWADEDTGEAAAEAEALWEADRALLARYAHAAETVVVGEVVALRPEWSSGGRAEIATLLIRERLLGDSVGLVEFRVPLVDTPAQVSLVEWHRLLVFLDRDGALVDGEALFFVEGGVARRSRYAGVLVRPDADRGWGDEADLLVDEVVLSLVEIRQQVNDSVQVGRKKWR